MKHFKWLVCVVVLVFMFSGCSSEPAQEISDATTAVEAAITEGADVYAADQARALKDDLQAAIDQGKANAGKLFGSNSEAVEKLAKIKAAAEELKASIPAKKEEAKNNAVTALEAAKTAIADAKALVETAPKGKGSKADIEAFTADLKALEDSLPEIQQAIDGESFFAAVDKCKPIAEKAAAISEQIKQAIEKVQAAKGKK